MKIINILHCPDDYDCFECGKFLQCRRKVNDAANNNTNFKKQPVQLCVNNYILDVFKPCEEYEPVI